MFRKIPIHPILFAIYPILFLYTNNISLLEIRHVFIPIIWSISGTLILWLIINLFSKNRFKSSVLTTIFAVLFFSYGHIFEIISDYIEETFKFSSDIYLSMNFVIIFILSCILILRSTENFESSSGYLNFTSIILLAFQIYTISTSQVDINFSGSHNESFLMANEMSVNINSPENKPDIYYIVLDGYGRNDVLESVYGFNNAEFIEKLEKREFYIAKSSYSNYVQTLLSLGATLNMNYLDQIPLGNYYNENYRSKLSEIIKDNLVIRLLRSIDYKFFALSSGYTGTEINNADIYLSPKVSFNEFKLMLIESTALNSIFKITIDKSQYEIHKERIVFPFEIIPKIRKDNTPMFLFAHIVAPHPPFVLIPEYTSSDDHYSKRLDFRDGSHYHGFDGNRIIDYKTKYILQLKEINRLLVKMIDDLIMDRDQNFIMIIQSDHGPAATMSWEDTNSTAPIERFATLNAVYSGNYKQTIFPDTISSVNTFRILFNIIFKTDFKILENKHYYSTWELPSNLIQIQL